MNFDATNNNNNKNSIGMCIHSLFENQVKKTPNAVAVVFQNEALTYQQLNQKANQLAHFLLQNEVGSETLIAISVERSFEMFIGIFGILKAGGAYVPIDPQTPKERIAFMLEEINSPLLLTQSHLQNAFPELENTTIIFLDKDQKTMSRFPDTNPNVAVNADHLIYTIFTSGSTGKPKGVQIEHRNVANLIEGQMRFVNHPVKRFLYAYSFAFDGSVLLIFWTLLQGATMVIAEENLEKDIQQFGHFIQQQNISHLLTFPSLYRMLLDQVDISCLQTLESVSVAGEACPAALVITHHQRLPETKLLNQYGPTEATVGSTVYITPSDFNAEKVPIGKPIENVEIHLLDENLKAVSVGVPGEIYIAGNGVARGYLNRPELTTERFIPNPFTKTVAPGLMYKTGDIAKKLPDGNLDFIGRADFQVKLRGYRIELGEIEAVLMNHSAVLESTVLLHGEDSQSQKLVAYLVFKKDERITVSELKHFLSNKLPDYMIPARFIVLSKMPLTVAGKPDRNALPIPGKDRPALEQPFVPPVTLLEKYLTNIWTEILDIQEIGILDKFFELGGNSLLAAQFINRIQKDLKVNIFIVTIFDAPTIKTYAELLEEKYALSLNQFFNVDQKEEKKHQIENNKIAKDDFRVFENAIPKIKNITSSSVSAKNKKTIFILAPPRSGTSLLRIMLAGHPDLFAANELQLLGFQNMQERAQAYSGKFSLWKEGLIRTIMELISCDADHAKNIIQQWETENYSTTQVYHILQNCINGKTLVDKSPSYALDINVLRKAEVDFENAVYIHLVRHPYAMIRSFEKMQMDQVMYLHDHHFKPCELAELIWTQSHLNIGHFFNEIPDDRKCIVLYESLVREPEKEMKAICEKLDIEYHPNLVQPYQNIEQKMTDGIYPSSKPMGDIRLLEHQKINPELANSYEQVKEDNFLSETTWRVAEKYGYENPDKTVNETNPSQHNNDIAIIGMSGRFPGAKNLKEFWETSLLKKMCLRFLQTKHYKTQVLIRN